MIFEFLTPMGKIESRIEGVSRKNIINKFIFERYDLVVGATQRGFEFRSWVRLKELGYTIKVIA